MRRWWGAIGGCVLLMLALCAGGEALAAPEVGTRAAADGTTVVTGNGWRPGVRLTITVGLNLYSTQADSAGGFELHTAVPFDARSTSSVAIRPAETLRVSALPEGVVPAAEDRPNAFAVLFAQSVASGMGWLIAAAAALGGVAVGRTLIRRLRGGLAR